LFQNQVTEMKTRSLLSVLILLAASATAMAAEGGLGTGMVNPGYHEPPAWFKSSFMDLQEDLAEAKAEQKRLILYFYQDGCPYCAKLLSVNWQDPKIVKKTRRNFDVIAINMWGDREVTDFSGNTLSEKRFAELNKVMYTPTLLLLNEKGDVALRINGYYPPEKFSAALDYVADKKENRLAFSDYYQEQGNDKASSRMHRDSNYLSKPYNLTARARGSQKPLLVLYEQRWCAPCDEMHDDIFQRQETRKYLQKFDIAQLDRWGKDEVITPTGKQTTALKWAHQLKVNYAPSLIFFDSDGKEVFRIEAYLKAFHVQSVLDYVSSGAYKTQPNLQRFIQSRADAMREKGIEVDLMK
jgi:thioredoxin-related protein